MGIKRLTFLVIFVSLSISLAFFLPSNVSNQLKHTLSLPFVPFQKISAFTANKFSDFWSHLFSFWDDGEEYEALKQKTLNLENVVIKQADIIFKLKNEIRSLAEFYDKGLAVKPVVANIIGYDTVRLKKSISIDLGSKHGIAVNDVVLYGNALVGRVASVSTFTSRIQLITDPDISVPCRILETRDQGIVKGTSGLECRLVYVADTVSVKNGARVVTSGVGGIYPGSLFVGAITRSRRIEGQLFLDILLKPAINISKIETVLVVRQESVEAEVK